MRIHIYSRAFAPAIGGMEKLIEVLAGEFVRQGHQVIVVTETPGQADLPYPVIRRPGFGKYLRLARQADVILGAPLSLRRIVAQFLSGKPVCIAHPVPFPTSGPRWLTGSIKHFAAQFVVNIVPSQYMATHFPSPIVIHNPFDAGTQISARTDRPQHSIVFVGRLVPEKGCHLLIEALARSEAAQTARLTIIGDGSERSALEQQAKALGLSERVHFAGTLQGPEVWAQMRSHQVMVVPSSWEEPFGIVALEGLACGCRMIVADSGGLPEAVGPLALTFPREDVEALADCLDRALSPDDHPPSAAAVAAHLTRFRPERIAADYLAVLQAAASQGRLAAVQQPL